MLCFRCSRTALSPNITKRIVDSTTRTGTSSITPLQSLPIATRPLSSFTSTSPILRNLFAPSRISSAVATSSYTPLPSSTLSMVSRIGAPRFFSTTASLGAKRNTYNPSRRVQKRRHGFLARLRTRGGQNVLARRRTKGRKVMSW